jgi:hypothetical protein
MAVYCESGPERLALVKLLLKYDAEVNFTSQGYTILDNFYSSASSDDDYFDALKTHLIRAGAKCLYYKKEHP